MCFLWNFFSPLMTLEWRSCLGQADSNKNVSLEVFSHTFYLLYSNTNWTMKERELQSMIIIIFYLVCFNLSAMNWDENLINNFNLYKVLTNNNFVYSESHFLFDDILSISIYKIKSIYIKMGVHMFVCLSVCWYVEG